jgi:hypothetical protein
MGRMPGTSFNVDIGISVTNEIMSEDVAFAILTNDFM